MEPKHKSSKTVQLNLKQIPIEIALESFTGSTLQEKHNGTKTQEFKNCAESQILDFLFKYLESIYKP